MKMEFVFLSRFKRFVRNHQNNLFDNGLIYFIQIMQTLQSFVFVQINNGFRMRFLGIDFIFQTLQNVRYIAKQREVFKLFQHRNGFGQNIHIRFRQRNIRYRKFVVFIFIIFFIINNNWRIITQFFTAHQLNIHLNRSFTNRVFAAFIFKQSFRTAFDQIFQSPLPVFILQTFVDRFVAY